MNYCYFVVEGPHDTEFLGKILKRRGFNRVTQYSDLSEFWNRMVPRYFPVDGDLCKRVPVPVFFSNGEMSIAIDSAIGENQLVEKLSGTLLNYQQDMDKIKSVGIIVDSDQINASKKHERLVKKFNKKNLPYSMPNNPGEISSSAPKIGLYVFPNNVDQGVLEDILLSCANIQYGSIYESSQAYIDSIDLSGIPPAELVDFRKPAGRKKAIAGCIAQIFKPGKSIQVSIQDNKWICDNTISLPIVSSFNVFVGSLID